MSLFSALDFRKEPWRPGPLLPPPRGRDSILVFVVALLTFLASLTAVAAMGASRAAGGWQAQVVGTASVLINPTASEGGEAAAIRATEVLAGVPGVEEAHLLERKEAEDLLRPWLGSQVLSDLPIPQLIAVDVDPKKPATALALDQALTAVGIDHKVDDHSQWTEQIRKAGLLAAIAALGGAVLLALATGAVVAHATRASISDQQPALELLHYSGAEDALIANLLVSRFSWLALIAALIGAGGAGLVAGLLRVFGGSQGLTPVLPIAWWDLLAVAAAPPAAAAVAALAARAMAGRLISRMP